MDTFLCVDAQKEMDDRSVHNAVCALEGTDEKYISQADIALRGIMLRTRVAGNVAGPYGVKLNEPLTRDELWDIFQDMPSSELRNFRIYL